MECQRCQKYFSSSLKLEGKTKRLGNRKYCLECSPFRAHNTRQIHLLTEIGKNEDEQVPSSKVCPRCKQEKRWTDYFVSARGNKDKSGNTYTTKRLSPYCKPCHNIQTQERQRELKRLCVAYKGGKCVSCGYSKNVKALDFHHVDPSKKDFVISSMSSFKYGSHVQAELDKCLLLCANCHREEHDRLYKEGLVESEVE